MEIWHNPRCSKSRQALTLLEEAGAEPEVRRYLDDPPTAAELDAALTALGLEPWELARMGEARAKELGLVDLERDRDAWIAIMVAEPDPDRATRGHRRRRARDRRPPARARRRDAPG